MTATALQTAAVAQSIPNPQTVALAVVCILAGMTVPTRYGVERLEGFGRSIVSKLPYRPPPGQDATEAMRAAVGIEQPADEQDQTGADE